MKAVQVLFVLLSSSLVFANSAGYDLKMDLSLNGKHISSPQIKVKSGELATVMQKFDKENTFIEVVAKDGSIQGNNGILMNFIVGTIGKNGERTIISKPQILAKENLPAQITVSGKDGAESLSLTVNVKKIAL